MFGVAHYFLRNEARQMLEALAKGAPGSRQTEEAKLSLLRLKATE